jgi:hypothetical protein
MAIFSQVLASEDLVLEVIAWPFDHLFLKFYLTDFDSINRDGRFVLIKV